MPFVSGIKVLNSVANRRQHRVSLQITDLFPHKTQSSAVLTPNFQGPRYLSAPPHSLTEALAVQVNVGGDTETDAEYVGLGAYILATVEAVAGGALTVGNANTIADNILARMRNNQSLTEDDVNTIIDAEDAGAGLAVGDSFASLTEILQIVSGYKVFTLPANTVVQLAGGDFDDAGLAVAVPAGFSDPSNASSLITTFDSSFYLSARKGQLKVAQSQLDDLGNPDPIVVCYADDGSLIQ